MAWACSLGDDVSGSPSAHTFPSLCLHPICSHSPKEDPRSARPHGWGTGPCFFIGRLENCGCLQSVPNVNHIVMAGGLNERKNAKGGTQSLAHGKHAVHLGLPHP